MVGSSRLQHNEFAWRVRLLGICLTSALRAATAHEYPAALALLRTAVEHQVFDRLLFLASRHVQVIEGVSDEVWERWQTQRPEFLLEWERLSKDRVRAVWRGARVVDEKGQFLHFLSVYYKWWKEYNPLVAPERDAAKLASGHPESPMARSAYARTQREMWRDVLAWKNLKESLLLNELASETEVVQIDVHHRFLSAYAHPFTEDMTDRLYGRNPRGGWPTEDHYAEELVLLYVCSFAIDELRDFRRMSQGSNALTSPTGVRCVARSRSRSRRSRTSGRLADHRSHSTARRRRTSASSTQPRHSTRREYL